MQRPASESLRDWLLNRSTLHGRVESRRRRSSQRLLVLVLSLPRFWLRGYSSLRTNCRQ